MASSLFALLDDIATVLDDVSLMTKVAAKKTAGVLGDDLAVNAEQVSGVQASRELPVVWAVAKGSALNKAILVPAALLISALAPWAITPLLMLGGAFLCFEAMEKVAHRFLHPRAEAEEEREILEALMDPAVDMRQIERNKIKGAIRTDFILSAEIIVISLGTVANAGLATRIGVLCAIAVIMTIGVYGLVAGIVKLDDLGLALVKRPQTIAKMLGRSILAFAPWLMKFLAVAGTIAMFLVGGGIVVHGIAVLHHGQEAIRQALGGGVAGMLAGVLYISLIGLVLGAAMVGLVEGGKKLIGRSHTYLLLIVPMALTGCGPSGSPTGESPTPGAAQPTAASACCTWITTASAKAGLQDAQQPLSAYWNCRGTLA
jgi:predicted DNA repair protein MutK